MEYELGTPLAAIDVGSNTIHLVVARPAKGGRGLRTLADELDLTRLGEDVSATGAIGKERQARAVAALRAQVAVAHAKGAAVIVGIATEGVRAAANAQAFLRHVEAETGVPFALLSGDEEAALTYWGATGGRPESGARRAVLDLGGGSLEVVVGVGTAIQWRVSLPLGSGAMRSRYAPGDPPSEGELAAVRAAVEETLRPLDVPLPVASALACGGTATTLLTLAGRALEVESAGGAVEENRRRRVLSRERMEALLGLLTQYPASEISARFEVEEARARMLGAGAMVLLGALDRLGVDRMRVSRAGVREGALLAYLHAGERWQAVACEGAGW